MELPYLVGWDDRGNPFLFVISSFLLGNVERVKIGQTGELVQASDVVVRQIQV